jgi:hypothetical protein
VEKTAASGTATNGERDSGSQTWQHPECFLRNNDAEIEEASFFSPLPNANPRETGSLDLKRTCLQFCGTTATTHERRSTDQIWMTQGFSTNEKKL